MASPSKDVIARARDRGWTHLDGPYFQRDESYYEYDPQSETMVITSRSVFEEFQREVEEAEREGVKEAVREAQESEGPESGTSKTQEDEIGVIGVDDAEMITKIDLADERQIVEEMKGRVLEKYFYSFQIAGREIIGLSYAGVKQLSREMARRGEPIDIITLEKEKDETHWTVTATAMHRKTKEHRYGVFRQPLVMHLKDGSTKDDDHALTKAVSKAQRNALRQFIPEEVIVEMYREWKTQRREREDF